MVNIGGLYWSKPTEAALAAISKWNIVILNDANTASNLEQPQADEVVRNLIKANGNLKVGISINAYSLFIKDGRPSVYWPIQVALFELANKLDAWLIINGKHVKSASNTWMFDLRNADFRKEFAALCNTFCMQRAAQFIHFDELHKTVRFLANLNQVTPDKLPTDEAWIAATNSFLDMIELPFMGNGTYDLSMYHPKMSRGRYVQKASFIPNVVQYLKYDLMLPVENRFSTINPTGIINRNDFAKAVDGMSINIQYYADGGEHYNEYNIERF